MLECLEPRQGFLDEPSEVLRCKGRRKEPVWFGVVTSRDQRAGSGRVRLEFCDEVLGTFCLEIADNGRDGKEPLAVPAAGIVGKLYELDAAEAEGGAIERADCNFVETPRGIPEAGWLLADWKNTNAHDVHDSLLLEALGIL